MTAMQADGSEAAPFDEAEAGDIVGEELADQLVEAIVFGRGGQRRADAASLRLGCDINAALTDTGIARTTATGGEPCLADRSLTIFGHQQRKSPLGLERRFPFGVRRVVEGAHRLGVARGGWTYRRSLDPRHSCLFEAIRHPGNGHVSKRIYACCGNERIDNQKLTGTPEVAECRLLARYRQFRSDGRKDSFRICRDRLRLDTVGVACQLARGEDCAAVASSGRRMRGRSGSAQAWIPQRRASVSTHPVSTFLGGGGGGGGGG